MARPTNSILMLSVARMAAVGCQFAALPVLARLLSPVEFGLVAIAMAVVGLTNALSDAGLGKSLLRDRERDELIWSSAFWLLSGIGVGLSLVLFALAPLVARIFDDPELRGVISVLSLLPFLLSFSSIFSVELERREAFATVAATVFVPTVAGVVVAIWLAMAGFGAWALVAQQVAQVGLQAAICIAASRFRPSFQFSLASLGEHLRFGWDTLLWSVLRFINQQSLTLVIGRIGTIADAGALAMTQRFNRLPGLLVTQPVNRVIYVRMAATHRTEGAVRDWFLTILRNNAFIIVPPLFMVAACGHSFFALLLSERWTGVGTFFALLAPGIALQTTLSVNGSAFMASGHTDLRLRLMLEMTVLWLVLLGLTAGFGGAHAIALARSVFFVLFLPRIAVFTRRAFDAGLGEILEAIWRPVAISALLWALHAGLSAQWALDRWQEVGLAAALLALAWACILATDLQALRGSFLRLLQEKGPSSP